MLLIFILSIGIGFYRAYINFTDQQTCASKPTSYNIDVFKLATSSSHEDILVAADIFMSAPISQEKYNEIFSNVLPIDACFAEKLYVRSAQLGNIDALHRLGRLYECSDGSFGASSTVGLRQINDILNASAAPDSLHTHITYMDYFPNPLRCVGNNTIPVCQILEKGTPEYQTKQAILCSNKWINE